MLSRLKKKKARKNIKIQHLFLIIFVGVLIIAAIKFKTSNPFTSH